MAKRNQKRDRGTYRLLSVLLLITLILIATGIVIGRVSVTPKPPAKLVGEYIEDAPTYGAFQGFTPKNYDSWNVKDYDFKYLDIDLDPDVQEFTYYLCAAYEIEYSFVLAIMEKESGFTPNALSPTNDYGLMQVNGGNLSWLSESCGVSDLFDPYDNVKAGLFILRTLFTKNSDPAKVLMSYNMGESGASKLWAKGIYSTPYSEDVLSRQARFVQLLGSDELD